MVPFDVNAANVRLGHESAIDYPTDNTNGAGSLGLPVGPAVATHADAVYTLNANLLTSTGQRFVIGWIVYSYTGSPTGGRLLIQDTTNTETILDVDISSGVKDFLWFQPCIRCKPNATITVTLKDGGAAVVGKVNVHAWNIL